MTTNKHDVWLESEAGALAGRFRGIVGEGTVRRFLIEAVSHLESRARVDTFVRLIAHRMAFDRLHALAQAEGVMPKDVPEVLFVCVHNAGRSQMAAVVTKALGGDRVHVRSAGSTPADEVNPAVVAAMTEAGYDLSQEFPKPLTDEAVRAADVVVTMGCGDACPIFPGKRYLDWVVEDPAGQPIEVVRGIRDEIQGRVETLLRELGVTSSTVAPPTVAPSATTGRGA